MGRRYIAVLVGTLLLAGLVSLFPPTYDAGYFDFVSAEDEWRGNLFGSDLTDRFVIQRKIQQAGLVWGEWERLTWYPVHLVHWSEPTSRVFTDPKESDWNWDEPSVWREVHVVYLPVLLLEHALIAMVGMLLAIFVRVWDRRRAAKLDEEALVTE